MENNKKQNLFIQFSGLGLQMLVTIYLSHYIGGYLDVKYANEGEWFSKGLTLLGVLLSTVLVIRQVQKIS